jgi:hypothetical protein
VTENATDLKFFTNEENDPLHARFSKTREHAKYFDVRAGSFLTNGFTRIYKPREHIEQTRIISLLTYLLRKDHA